METRLLKQLCHFCLILAFLGASIIPSSAGEIAVPLMPAAGKMVSLSLPHQPAHLAGITIHADNPLKFDFLIHSGQGNLNAAEKSQEYQKLIKYFLASLTIPDHDQWVNLSPYEKDRIIGDNFGKTEMGRDLLAQDYLLKQITSSLMYPDAKLGKDFWDTVYAQAYKELGHTNIPVNTFNKVWIVPDEAVIYEAGNTAYILKSHLKVMMEEDYLATTKNITQENKKHPPTAKVIKDIILPHIEREVNEGKNFALLRQIYSGMILATWCKKALKESLLGKVYADKSKVGGVDQDPKSNAAIYEQYLNAFKKGVYSLIKEDRDKYSQQLIPRKYFSGGALNRVAQVMEVRTSQNPPNPAMLTSMVSDFSRSAIERAQVNLKEAQIDAAMSTLQIPTILLSEEQPVRFVEYSPQGQQQAAVDMEIPDAVFEQGLLETTADKIAAAASGNPEIVKDTITEGRSRVLLLKENERFEINNQKVASLRIKGATFRGGLPVMEAYTGNDNNVIQSKKIMTADKDGRIVFPQAPPLPKGMLLAEAQREYDNARFMAEAGLPVNYPIGVGQFIDMEFGESKEKVGFVVFGSASSEQTRLRTFFVERLKEEAAKMKSAGRFNQAVYAELSEAVKSAANILREVHERGFIHANPHLDQFDYAAGKVNHIYDFEQSIDRLTISQEEFTVRLIVDFMSFYLSMDSLLSSGVVPTDVQIGLSGIRQQVYKDFVDSYFKDVSSEIGAINLDVYVFLKSNVLRAGQAFSKLEGLTWEQALNELSKQNVLIQILGEIAGNIYAREDKAMAARTIELSERAQENKEKFKKKIDQLYEDYNEIIILEGGEQSLKKLIASHIGPLKEEAKKRIEQDKLFGPLDNVLDKKDFSDDDYKERKIVVGQTHYPMFIVQSIEQEGLFAQKRPLLKKNLQKYWNLHRSKQVPSWEGFMRFLNEFILEHVSPDDIDWNEVRFELEKDNAQIAREILFGTMVAVYTSVTTGLLFLNLFPEFNPLYVTVNTDIVPIKKEGKIQRLVFTKDGTSVAVGEKAFMPVVLDGDAVLDLTYSNPKAEPQLIVIERIDQASETDNYMIHMSMPKFNKRFLFKIDPDNATSPFRRFGNEKPQKVAPSRGLAGSPTGGIDLNAANLNLRIKRDGKGVALPLAQQDPAALANIRGFVPQILEITPAQTPSFLTDLGQN